MYLGKAEDGDLDPDMPRRPRIIGPHTCRSLVLAVLMLGGMALKKASDGRREQQKIPLQKENLRQFSADMARLSNRKFGEGEGFDPRDHLSSQDYSSTIQGIPGNHVRGIAAAASGGAGHSRGVPPARVGMILLGIAVGAVMVWFLIMRGMRALRQWATSSKHRSEGAGGENPSEDSERAPLTKSRS